MVPKRYFINMFQRPTSRESQYDFRVWTILSFLGGSREICARRRPPFHKSSGAGRLYRSRPSQMAPGLLSAFGEARHEGIVLQSLRLPSDFWPSGGRHYEVKVNGAWVVVPPDKVVKRSAPDMGLRLRSPQLQRQTGTPVLRCVAPRNLAMLWHFKAKEPLISEAGRVPNLAAGWAARRSDGLPSFSAGRQHGRHHPNQPSNYSLPPFATHCRNTAMRCFSAEVPLHPLCSCHLAWQPVGEAPHSWMSS